MAAEAFCSSSSISNSSVQLMDLPIDILLKLLRDYVALKDKLHMLYQMKEFRRLVTYSGIYRTPAGRRFSRPYLRFLRVIRRGSRQPGPSFSLADRREPFASFSVPLRAGRIRNPQSSTNRFSLQSLKMLQRDAATHALQYQQFLGRLSLHGGHELADLSSAGSSRSIILSSTVCSGCWFMTAEPS